MDWKKQTSKKCLVVDGARQVGKTFAIKQFGETYYDELFYINFKETPSAMDSFTGDLDVNTLIFNFKLQNKNVSLFPGKTLIFLDEIQECEQALTSLKFWTIDGRYDVIASGSMLGIDYKRASSYPVGYIETQMMYGLDFEEFLWSQGIDESMISRVKEYYDNKKVVPDAIHNKFMSMFRLYAAIGGMPEVVWNFVQTNDMAVVDKIQKELLQGYLFDIAHYASAEDKIKAEKCYLSIARQLLDKDNPKFQYKEVEKGGRAQKYLTSIDWLMRANIIALSYSVTDVCYDLTDYVVDSNFRAYASDMSFVIAMRDYSIKQEIIQNSFKGNTKGGIYECVAADILNKRGYKLFFYRNETTKRELDFIIQKNGNVVPIEIKSGNTRAKSLNNIIDKREEISIAYKFVDGNVGLENKVLTLPLYMLMFV
ncbi:MAG: ATP-binding protein [Saccharofermentans sp.]|nr:ATP-binding protein [Saccharofermentans sp.]